MGGGGKVNKTSDILMGGRGEREGERSVFFCGHRYMLWDQDTT